MFEIPLVGNVVHGSYEWGLVFLSYGIAVFASYTALDLAHRIEEVPAGRKKIWIAGCALVMGCGIWAMHFTAMQAFKIPMPVSYGIGYTVLSLVVAAVASGYGLFYSHTKPISKLKILFGGLIMGSGVAAMHYIGMGAMKISGAIHYQPFLFVLSIGVGVLAATAALWLIVNSAHQTFVLGRVFKVVSPLVMGMAIVGMHYTGMAGTVFTAPAGVMPDPLETASSPFLAFVTAGMTLLILGVAIFASTTQGEFYKLRSSRDDLELAVQERTRELTQMVALLNSEIDARKAMQGQLEAARTTAEKANLAKSEFLARMSHELRTPMNAILGFAQLLEMDVAHPLVDYQMDNLKSILSAGNHLLELINEVLDLSKVESGNLILSVEPVDMVPIVDNVISISKPLADKNGISLEYQKIPQGSFYVEVDKLRFKQVVLNLVSNAIKYNKPNGSVIVSFEKRGGNTIRLGVRDTGRGISAGQRDKLFKPFERFDIEAEKIEGTGIGLVIAKQLIELMQGTIGFESALGEGSFFYMDIPLSAKTPALQINEESDSTSSFLIDSRKRKILYIEDIPANVELVRMILNKRPLIELISAANAVDGIKIARSLIPDLIIMDIHLPGMDGLTAFQKLQGMHETKNIPVIALTADAMDADIKKALKMGFHSYVTKPIDVRLFIKNIDGFM